MFFASLTSRRDLNGIDRRTLPRDPRAGRAGGYNEPLFFQRLILATQRCIEPPTPLNPLKVRHSRRLAIVALMFRFFSTVPDRCGVREKRLRLPDFNRK